MHALRRAPAPQRKSPARDQGPGMNSTECRNGHGSSGFPGGPPGAIPACACETLHQFPIRPALSQRGAKSRYGRGLACTHTPGDASSLYREMTELCMLLPSVSGSTSSWTHSSTSSCSISVDLQDFILMVKLKKQLIGKLEICLVDPKRRRHPALSPNHIRTCLIPRLLSTLLHPPDRPPRVGWGRQWGRQNERVHTEPHRSARTRAADWAGWVRRNLCNTRLAPSRALHAQKVRAPSRIRALYVP